MSSIKGFPFSGKLQDLDDASYERLQERFVTVMPIGPVRAGLDTYAMGVYRVGASARVVEAGSDDKQLVLTGHDFKKGDIVRLLSTTNPIEEYEISVRRIVDANTVEFNGVLSASLTTGDTFDILRAVPQRFDSTGASLASVVSPPIQFERDGSTVTVTEDTVTPANNLPLPVKLTDITGDINITANDLNVQLSHSAANPDSVQIGDGTDLLAINADGSINVQFSATDLDIRDLSASQDNVAISDGTDTLAINADGSINVGATDLDIRDLSHTQDSVRIGDGTDLLAINADGSINTTISATDLDIRDLSASQDNVAISDGTHTLDINADGSIDAVVTATDLDIRDLAHTQDSVRIGDGVELANVNASNELQVADDTARTTLSTISGKLPASLGQTTAANSLAVVPASDYVPASSSGRSAVDYARLDYSSTNVTTGAFVELKAAVAQDAEFIEIFDSSGQTLELAFGGSGSEVVQFRIFPGGNGQIPLTVAQSTRISLRAVSANATAGEININFYN